MCDNLGFESTSSGFNSGLLPYSIAPKNKPKMHPNIPQKEDSVSGFL